MTKTNPDLNLDPNQNDIVDSSIGFGASFGIFMLIFIGMMIAEYMMK